MPESPLLRLLRKRWPLAAALAIGLIAIGASYRPGVLIGYLREQASPMELFTLILFLIFAMPPLCARLRLPAAVGLLLAGVLLGPFVLDLVDPDSGTVSLFASLGRVFLMFIAGLEIDLAVFAATRNRSMTFGALTFLLPLAAGTLVGHIFGFDWNAAVLIGSLIASHTLLGFPIVVRPGLGKSEVVAVTVGATIFTDIASLLVLAVCISIHLGGFSPLGLATQLFSLAVYAVIVLQGLPLLGRLYFRRHREDEAALFTFTFLVVLLAAAGAHFIHLEDIVGAFLAGIAVNRVLTGTPVKDKVVLMGEGLFIPLFFVTIGVGLDLPVFWATLSTNLGFVVALAAALFIAKFAAAAGNGLLFGYPRDAILTQWSLSLPQVAATLAAAMAAYNAVNADDAHLITESVLNGVIVLMVLSAVLGPVLTEVFGRRLIQKENTHAPASV
ncbi:cation:proton antiporter [uncultured Thiodictyon sp.]|uniref:cation:proton antiporter n=1 Tax=uncultured Thiodictyon sp. TaxID=1846217 RepID=UPI0025E3834D|nr:cation:proton antiporter [uncultured Thiodictyon sp.]